jgi:hypothetical protein
MGLSEAEKTDARRFCGYPASGGTGAGLQAWRGYQTFGLLEYRLNNLSDAELTVARRYLATLTGLEIAVPIAAQNLDTDQAAIWTRNKDEPRDRLRLLDEWRRRFATFLGVPAGPGLSGGTVTWVV